MMSHVLFALQAAVAIVTTSVTVINFEKAEGTRPSAVEFSRIVFTLALFSSLVAGINAFTNPGVRWRVFEEHMCKIETNIWRFRTRTGLLLVSSAMYCVCCHARSRQSLTRSLT